jgi:hypothetical protein
VFSARELFAHRVVAPELAAAFDAAGIRDARVLCIRLRQLCGSGLMRVKTDNRGAMWTVEA